MWALGSDRSRPASLWGSWEEAASHAPVRNLVSLATIQVGLELTLLLIGLIWLETGLSAESATMWALNLTHGHDAGLLKPAWDRLLLRDDLAWIIPSILSQEASHLALQVRYRVFKLLKESLQSSQHHQAHSKS